MALVGLNTYYAFPNVDESNNQIAFHENGESRQLTLPVGCYEITSINREVMRQMDWKKETAAVTFTPNNTTLNCVMNIKKNWQVDFFVENSLAGISANVPNGTKAYALIISDRVVKFKADGKKMSVVF